MTRLEPETLLRNFLRGQLTDYNSSRVAGKEWIYDDWTRDDLKVGSFPRVAIRKIGESGGMIGCADDTTWDGVIFQIDVLIHRDLGVLSVTHTTEALGVISNSPRLSFDYPAGSVTNIKHTTTAFGTVTKRTNNSDFTTPSAGTVEWSLSTGELNFATADLSTYTGQSITATYVELLEGERLAKRIGRDIVVAIRSQWRNDDLLSGLIIPEKVSGPSVVEFGKPEGWHRVMLEYKFNSFNTGEE